MSRRPASPLRSSRSGTPEARPTSTTPDARPMEPRPLHEAHDGEGEGEANRSTTFPPSHEVDDDDDDSGGLPPSQDEALPPGWRPRGPNFPTSDGKLRPRTKQTALVKHPWPHLGCGDDERSAAANPRSYAHVAHMGYGTFLERIGQREIKSQD